MAIKQTAAKAMAESGNVQEALKSCRRNINELAEVGVTCSHSNRIVAVINGLEKIREERKRKLEKIILCFGGFSVLCFAAAAVLEMFGV